MDGLSPIRRVDSSAGRGVISAGDLRGVSGHDLPAGVLRGLRRQ
jgi:hypothetical protein